VGDKLVLLALKTFTCTQNEREKKGNHQALAHFCYIFINPIDFGEHFERGRLDSPI
jgi:hypothetical protein